MNQIKIHYQAVVIFSVLCLFLTGCGNKEETVRGETTDIFGSYTISPSGALKNNGNGYLLFYDKETDSTVYLCNRAGCRHIDHTCGAYFEHMSLPFFYDGNLYVVASLFTGDGNAQIFRADRYGENRELIRTIAHPVLQIEIIENELYFFGLIMGEEVDNSRSSVGQLLCRLNLDTGEYEEFPNIDTGYPNAMPGHFTVTDNFIYFNYTASSIDPSELFDPDTGELKDIAWDEIVYTDLVYRMDRDTRETELIYTREKTGGNFGASVLEENEHSLILFSPDRIWEYNMQTGKETTLYEPITEMDKINKIGDYYLSSHYPEINFTLLKDWQETASFSGLDYEIDSYFGISGDTAYFGRNGNLCAIEYEDLINGSYDFRMLISER